MTAQLTRISLFLTVGAFLAALGAASPTAALVKRFDDAPFTKFDVSGATSFACGPLTPGESEIISLVSVASEQWDNGSHCQKSVDILFNGTQFSGIVIDECLDCADTGLGLDINCFHTLAGFDNPTDVIFGDWDFV